MNESSFKMPESFRQPAFVHSVLLSSKEERAQMRHFSPSHTQTYEEYESMLQESSQAGTTSVDFNAVVKAAFRDKICEQIQTSGDIQPAKDLLLELHKRLRSLIPSRKDLHGILRDDYITAVSTIEELNPFVIAAAEALVQLESQARAETTMQLIRLQKNSTNIREVITSILYLLYKAELCEADKQDFYLTTMWIPEIVQNGIQWERTAFQERFGSFDDPNTAPATRKWLQELVSSVDKPPSTLASPEKQFELLQMGWIDGIIFRSNKESLELPEVLYLDISHLQEIRRVTRLAAAGSALAVHVCNATGQPKEMLNGLADIQIPLKDVIVDQVRPDYEENVIDNVISLARHYNAELDSSNIDFLRHRTIAVLRAEDPVIQLLESRIKACFREIMLHARHHIPNRLESGRAVHENPVKSAVTSYTERLFCNKGLALYAVELAQASELAQKIIELCWSIYGDVLLSPILLYLVGQK